MIPDDFVDVLKETGAWEDKSLRARNRDARSEDETVRKPRLVDCIADLRIALSSRGYETTAQSALHSTVTFRTHKTYVTCGFSSCETGVRGVGLPATDGGESFKNGFSGESVNAERFPALVNIREDEPADSGVMGGPVLA